MFSLRFGKLAVLVSAGLLSLGSTRVIAQEVWSVREGAITLELNYQTLESLGLQVDGPSAPDAVSDPFLRYVLPLDGGVDIPFAVLDGGRIELSTTDLRAVGGITLRGAKAEVTVLDFALLEGGDATTAGAGDATKPGRGPAYFEIINLKAGMNRQTDTLELAGRELSISLALAAALDRLELAGVSIGRVAVSAPSQWIGGDAPAPFQAVPPDGDDLGGREVMGCDMTFCQLYGLQQYGRLGDIVGLTKATTSWNISTDTDCIWWAIPDEEHPFIVMNVFRLKTVDGSERLEQIGQSWIKHGFYALPSTQCGTGGCNFEPGHGAGDWLGMNCTDTYSASHNATQSNMTPRFEVDPWTGYWLWGPDAHQWNGHGHNPIEHRLQVHDADLDSAGNPGATYYGEGYYVMLDDVDVMNSASWKEAPPSGSPGSTWSFGMSGSGVGPNIGFAYNAWSGTVLTLLAEEIPVEEFRSPDGRCVLSAKTTDLGGGTWHYEYALYNIDMDRQVGSFSIPISPGTIVSNVGFHAVEHHDELWNTVDPDQVPIDNAAWTSQGTSDAVTWSTTTNPLRWGTMYNFRFDANVEPAEGRITVTLGLFRPGTPTEVMGETIGPLQEPVDCDGNGIPDNCDLDCGLPGGDCDVPDCGQADDCNGNGVLDECEGNLLPGITEQPASLTVCEGESASFSAGADGWEPLSYQWRLNGVDIPGGTSSVYAIDPVTPADAGDYDVVVANVCGAVTSDLATLIVVVDADCDDINPCTDDSCSAGTCGHVNNTVPCDDLDACTVDDVCAAGACEGTYQAHPYGDIQPVPDPPATFPCSDPEEQARAGDGFLTMLDVMCAFNAMNDGFPHTNCPCADVNPCGGDVFLTMLDVMSIFNTMNDPASAPCPDPCP